MGWGTGSPSQIFITWELYIDLQLRIHRQAKSPLRIHQRLFKIEISFDVKLSASIHFKSTFLFFTLKVVILPQDKCILDILRIHFLISYNKLHCNVTNFWSKCNISPTYSQNKKISKIWDTFGSHTCQGQPCKFSQILAHR